ncbi:hypothetical protein NIES4071_103450 (plasmid) [Calothrix sp. NIES-4071]|nr:hypothetical protein NIES4071_103450 [Calothrix sp. NIES-4071]BAZ64332.1 hypothetical protein NIES4105_100650 [Calothrix sp. NIES-4105]
MKIRRTSKRNGCRVCGGHDSKCGWLPDTDIHFCMNINDAISAPPRWKYLGETRNGMWGMFVPDEGKQYTEEEIAAYKERKASEELRRRLHHTESLSEASRHRQLTSLVNQLPLNECHCEDLRRRNLSDELIKRGNFRSIGKFQKLDFELSHNLAGVSINGMSLTNPCSGYMVPIWNEHSQMIGYQIRNDDSEGAKYIWATSNANARRLKGVSSHLQNGELPLTFCVSDKIVSDIKNNNSCIQNGESVKLSYRINIAEGFLKPFIIAHLRELLVIGAAGGNFVGSLETFKRYLDAASLMLGGTREVVLWADAGAIANKHVMRQYRKTYSVLRRWGYKLQIAWWGQIDKNCFDGDEYLGDYELISWYEFESMSRNPGSILSNIEKIFQSARHHLKRNKPTTTTFIPTEKQVHTYQYVPGNLPTYGDYVEMGCPTVTYKNNERATIFHEATQLKGWSHILDGSAPGLGKSHTVGSLTAEYMGVDQLMYLASDHRNPTTITIEKNFVDVFPRHNGMKKDPTRQTQAGKDFLMHRVGDDKSDIPPNCARASLFSVARDKNINLESSGDMICQGCILFDACKAGRGNNYGYLSDRRIALSYSQIRLHPDSTPLPKNYGYSKVGLIWEETSVLFNVVKDIKVDSGNLYNSQLASYMQATKMFMDEPSKNPLALPLTMLGEKLPELFSLPKDKLGRYGLGDASIHTLLGKAPAETMVTQEAVANYTPNLDFLFQTSDTIDTAKLSAAEKRSAGKFNKLLSEEHNDETLQQLKSLPLNWLPEFMAVWAKHTPGCFSFNNGVLTIHKFNGRHREVAHAAAFNIYLDGTMPVDNLALKLGVPREHILVLKTETPDYSNLEIVHIPDMGVLSRDRRDSQQVRVDALREAIVNVENKKFNNAVVGVIERKAYAREGDGYHFRDSRGINRFSNVAAIIGIGAPYANIGAMQAEFTLLLKDKFKRDASNGIRLHHVFKFFVGLPLIDLVSYITPRHIANFSEQEYIDKLVDAEILQEVGRLRSHLRRDESLTRRVSQFGGTESDTANRLTYYFVGEYDLGAVLNELPGVRYTCKESCEYSIKACGGTRRLELMVFNAAGSLISSGIKSPTQKQVIEFIETRSDYGKVSQGRISQIMQRFGGWGAILKLIAAVLLGVKEKDKPCTANSFDDEEWIIKTYLPLILQTAVDDPVEAARELVSIAVAHGWDALKKCISCVGYELQQQLVELVLGLYALLDAESVEELAALGTG